MSIISDYNYNELLRLVTESDNLSELASKLGYSTTRGKKYSGVQTKGRSEDFDSSSSGSNPDTPAIHRTNVGG